MGVKGSGKTKHLIDLVNVAAHSEAGNVICIERGPKLIYDVHYKVRLVEASRFDFKSFEFLKGFISGLYACDFDISHIFVDSLCKIVPSSPTDPETIEFLNWLDAFSEKNGIRFTITISADINLATEEMKKYLTA